MLIHCIYCISILRLLFFYHSCFSKPLSSSGTSLNITGIITLFCFPENLGTYFPFFWILCTMEKVFKFNYFFRYSLPQFLYLFALLDLIRPIFHYQPFSCKLHLAFCPRIFDSLTDIFPWLMMFLVLHVNIVVFALEILLDLRIIMTQCAPQDCKIIIKKRDPNSEQAYYDHLSLSGILS